MLRIAELQLRRLRSHPSEVIRGRLKEREEQEEPLKFKYILIMDNKYI